MKIEAIVREMAAAAPSGTRLASYREVALPLFRVDVELLVLEKKELPPIQEHVLRAVALGLRSVPDVAGFLGIEEAVARSATAGLLRSDDLVLSGGEGEDRAHRLKLTTKGSHSAKDAARVQAVESTLHVWVDGLTRDILSVKKDHRWFPAGEAGLAEIGASPKRKPDETEVALELVKEKLKEEMATRRSHLEVIALTGLGKVRRFSREGLALAFEHPDEGLSVSLVVDRKVSERHSDAFARVRARSNRNLKAADWEAVEEIGDDLPPDLLAEAKDDQEIERIAAERSDAQQERDRLEASTIDAQGPELERLRGELENARTREAALQAELDGVSVRQVPVWEHREYLDRALETASSRLIIVSPWIRHEVVDDYFVKRLRGALERGVELWIGHGISKEPRYRSKEKGEADRDAENKLSRLAADYPQLFRLRRLGDTHAKVLVCDNRFSILTSFNWLSFKGDERLEFRDERGYYVGLTAQVDSLVQSYAPRFSAS
jgi:hypothetical protein